MDEIQQLGKRILFLRKERKLSQEDLALEAKINKNYLCDLERGVRNPTFEILLRLSRAFGINPDELLKGIKLK